MNNNPPITQYFDIRDGFKLMISHKPKLTSFFNPELTFIVGKEGKTAFVKTYDLKKNYGVSPTPLLEIFSRQFLVGTSDTIYFPMILDKKTKTKIYEDLLSLSNNSLLLDFYQRITKDKL